MIFFNKLIQVLQTFAVLVLIIAGVFLLASVVMPFDQNFYSFDQ